MLAINCRRLVQVKWLDINKGDDVNHEYRSRLVAKEIKMDKRLDLFAATPPLEAKKLFFSAAISEGMGYKEGERHSGMKIDFIDISMAFFQAETQQMRFAATKVSPQNQLSAHPQAGTGDGPYLLPRTPLDSQQRRTSDGNNADPRSRNPVSLHLLNNCQFVCVIL